MIPDLNHSIRLHQAADIEPDPAPYGPLAIPYPLRAVRLSLDFKPFGFWLKPSFTHRKSLTERAKANGETIWWARWAWFQISYSRWV